MKKKTFNMATATNSTLTPTFENNRSVEKILLDSNLPTPPSEETIARLNAIAREYPFCAYMKQKNRSSLL